ncbi:hypothetical protein [Flavobacterium sp. XS2P39]|uniref:hypothetical protein n=1 Tax=Flavobacterium sp. XS2P39 TaxID=3401725 RepID=UPI003AB068FC
MQNLDVKAIVASKTGILVTLLFYSIHKMVYIYIVHLPSTVHFRLCLNILCFATITATFLILSKEEFNTR